MDDQQKSLKDRVVVSVNKFVELNGAVVGYAAEVGGIIGIAHFNKSGDLIAGIGVYLGGRMLNTYRRKIIAQRELDERIMNLRYDLADTVWKNEE